MGLLLQEQPQKPLEAPEKEAGFVPQAPKQGPRRCTHLPSTQQFTRIPPSSRPLSSAAGAARLKAG